MQDTIAAIATPPGSGGIGVIRVSGPLARSILGARFAPASPVFRDFRPWTLHRGAALDQEGGRIDDVLAVFMPGPRTFTGEDVAEWHCHGGPALLEALLESILAAGARPAERGEFTRRAFLNGRMDLTQAEAVAEVIAAPSREGARLAAARLHGLLGARMTALRDTLENLRARMCLAVDFPEEEAECLSPADLLAGVAAVDEAAAGLLAAFDRARCWREGVTAALAGPVNAGKSSLMNALLGRERAIVTDHPGTTRDFLEESVRLDGLPARLIDTAGLRGADAALDPAERQGIRLGQEKTAEADVIFLVFDGSRNEGGVPPELPGLAADLAGKGRDDRIILVWNKRDLAPPPEGWAAVWRNAWRNAVRAAGIPPSALAEQGVGQSAGQGADRGKDHPGEGNEPWTAAVSARSGEGLDDLARLARRVALAGRLTPAGSVDGEETLAPNLRQAVVLRRLRQDLASLAADARDGVPYDLCAVRLEVAVAALAEITGLDTPDEVLNRIFASFCIGK